MSELEDGGAAELLVRHRDVMPSWLDVKVNDYPTHAASKPVALLPNCAATRHAHFVLDGTHWIDGAPIPPDVVRARSP